MLLSNHSHSPVELQRCTPGRSSGHSILAGQLVLCYLDSPTSPAFPGYLADRGGPGCLSVLPRADLEVLAVLEVPDSQPLDSPSLPSLLADLYPLVVRSGHWYQGSLACRLGLALPEVPVGLSYLALRVARVLFGLTPLTGRGSGSVWNYNETNGSG